MNLIACLHDVTPRDFARLVEIDRFYEEIGIGSNYAMLVVPNFWGVWSLEKHPTFVNWLMSRAEAGVEMILHGFYHFDTTPKTKRLATTRLRHALLGEGEFATLAEADAAARLQAGRKMFADIFGWDVRSFVAPAWQYSAGSRIALAKLGFEIAENRGGVWSPVTGRLLTATPVIAYSNRDSLRRNLSLRWSRETTKFLAAARIVRHAIHPGDFDNDLITAEIRRSLRELLANRQAARYRALLSNLALA